MFGKLHRPALTKITKGDYVDLQQCEACASFWCESPYEPYLSFPFLALWPYDEARWRKTHWTYGGERLRGWHAYMVGQHYQNLSAVELEFVEQFRCRTRGHNPIDSPQIFHAADL